MNKVVQQSTKNKRYDAISAFRGAGRGRYTTEHLIKDRHREREEEEATTAVRYFTLKDGAVMLAPDVKKYFSSSESVNRALRSLIAIIPAKKRSAARGK